jgi:hypothetical protein
MRKEIEVDSENDDDADDFDSPEENPNLPRS